MEYEKLRQIVEKYWLSLEWNTQHLQQVQLHEFFFLFFLFQIIIILGIFKARLQAKLECFKNANYFFLFSQSR
jgi:hypothetical protein